MHAMCAFKNASSCDKNVCREIPGGLVDCAQRAHCVGERSMITLRCEGLSILHQRVPSDIPQRTQEQVERAYDISSVFA